MCRLVERLGGVGASDWGGGILYHQSNTSKNGTDRPAGATTHTLLSRTKCGTLIAALENMKLRYVIMRNNMFLLMLCQIKRYIFILAVPVLFMSGCTQQSQTQQTETAIQQFVVNPIGKVVRKEGRTFIMIQPKYRDGLLRLDRCSHVTVLYWFHKNDTPQKRSVLQVNPGGNKDRPITGVFATHSPMRPNLIAISRVKVMSVKDTTIEIESIDAFDDTPVIDIKN